MKNYNEEIIKSYPMSELKLNHKQNINSKTTLLKISSSNTFYIRNNPEIINASHKEIKQDDEDNIKQKNLKILIQQIGVFIFEALNRQRSVESLLSILTFDSANMLKEKQKIFNIKEGNNTAIKFYPKSILINTLNNKSYECVVTVKYGEMTKAIGLKIINFSNKIKVASFSNL